jgi:hypothetical protein
VPALVARVRDAFVDEDGAPQPIRAEAWLSEDEARCGLELPMAVRWRHACPSCSGRGERWLESCPRCGGTGERMAETALVVTVPPHVRDGDAIRVPVAREGAAAAVEIRVRIQPAEPAALEGEPALRPH